MLLNRKGVQEWRALENINGKRNKQSSDGNMKSKEQIEEKILDLVGQKKGANKRKYDTIHGAINALEWVLEELNDPNSVMQDTKPQRS